MYHGVKPMAYRSRQFKQTRALVTATLVTLGALGIGMLLAFVIAPIGPKQVPPVQIVHAR